MFCHKNILIFAHHKNVIQNIQISIILKDVVTCRSLQILKFENVTILSAYMGFFRFVQNKVYSFLHRICISKIKFSGLYPTQLYFMHIVTTLFIILK